VLRENQAKAAQEGALRKDIH